jgi:hypothetical protein
MSEDSLILGFIAAMVILILGITWIAVDRDRDIHLSAIEHGYIQQMAPGHSTPIWVQP